MLTIVMLAATVFTIVFLMVYQDPWCGASDALLIAGCSLVASSFVGFGIAVGIGSGKPIELVENNRVELVTLADVSGTSGTIKSGLLGTTAVFRQSNAFNYYVENDGAYTLHSAPADKSKIKLDSETPHMIEFCAKRTAPSNKWAIVDNSCQWYEYEFHIPKGSLVESIELDGK